MTKTMRMMMMIMVAALAVVKRKRRVDLFLGINCKIEIKRVVLIEQNQPSTP
ncbi:hypothetical protein WUBG_05426, partial [Wuchereria bancrofti]